MMAQRGSMAAVGVLLLAAFAGVPVATAAAPSVSVIEMSNAAFSPNNDGSKDTTTMTVTLSQSYTGNLYANVYDGTGSLVRTGLPLSGSGTVWSAAWDGKNDVGAVVAAGTYTLRASGNNYGGGADEATSVAGSVVVDLTAPTALSILIQGTDTGNQYTNAQTVALTLAATGATMMSFREGTTGDFSTPETFATTRQFTLSATEGSKTLYFRARDDAGNIATPVSASIILDTTGPTEGRVLVENDQKASTTSTTVNLTVQGTGATLMRFSNDGGTTWSGWETFATSKSGFSLAAHGGSGSQGTKTVSVQLKDAAGNAATGTPDSITLDQTAPSITTDPASSDVTSTAATISWQTDEASSSYVEYGTASGSYTLNSGWTQLSGTTAHTVALANLAPGATYYYKVRSKDAAGNAVASSEETFQTSSTVSNVPRDLTLSINAGAALTKDQAVTLTLGGTEVAEYRLSNDGNAWSIWTTFTNSVSWNLVSGTGVDGTKTVFFQARNSAGQAASAAEDSITLDTTAPAVSSATATPAATSIAISWSTDEATTGSVAYGTAADALSTTVTTAQGTSHQATLSGLVAGVTYYYKITATDLAGNAAQDAEARTAATTSTPPSVVSVTISGTPAVTNNPSVSLALAATGATEMQFSNDGATFSALETYRATKTWSLVAGAGGSDADGTKTVTFRATNPAGTTTATYEIYLDRAAPSISGPASPTLAWSPSSPAIDLAATDAKALAKLEYRVTSGPSGTGTTRVDWTSLSGVSGTSASKTFTVALGSLADGFNYVSARATDTAGNERVSSDVAVIRLDRAAPTTSMTALPAIAASPVSLAWTGSDPLSGIDGYTLQMKAGGGSWVTIGSGWTNTSASLALVDGVSYSFRVLATDKAGNALTLESAQTTAIADAANPIPGALRATAGTLFANLDWDAATDVSGISAYRVFHATAEGGPYSQVGADLLSAQREYTADELSAGMNWFKIAAVDAFGRVSFTNALGVNVLPAPGGGDGGDTGGGGDGGDGGDDGAGGEAPLVDLRKPVSIITIPAANAFFNDAFTIRGTATDDVEVELVEVSLDGGKTWSEASGTSIWSFKFDPEGQPDGRYTVLARARDTAGKIGDVKAGVPFTIDRKAPAIENAAPKGVVSEARPSITAEIKDAFGVNLATLVVTLDGEAIAATLADGKLVAPLLRDLGMGVHTVKVEIRDFAGNSAMLQWAFETLVKDEAPPKVAIESPAEGAELGMRPEVVATFSDNVGIDLSKIEVLVNGVPVRPAAVSEKRLSFIVEETGPISVVVRVRDEAGNKAEAVRAFRVLAEGIVFEFPIQDAGTFEIGKTFIVKAKGAPIAKGSMRVLLDGVDVTSKLEPAEGGFALPLSLLTEGDHTVAISARDHGGAETIRKVTFRVAAPELAPAAPQAAAPEADAKPPETKEKGGFKIPGFEPLLALAALGALALAARRRR